MCGIFLIIILFFVGVIFGANILRHVFARKSNVIDALERFAKVRRSVVHLGRLVDVLRFGRFERIHHLRATTLAQEVVAEVGQTAKQPTKPATVAKKGKKTDDAMSEDEEEEEDDDDDDEDDEDDDDEAMEQDDSGDDDE